MWHPHSLPSPRVKVPVSLFALLNTARNSFGGKHQGVCQDLSDTLPKMQPKESPASRTSEVASYTPHPTTTLVTPVHGLYHRTSKVTPPSLLLLTDFPGHAVPLPKLPTGKETTKWIINHVFQVSGIPQDIVTDHGPQFYFHFWHAFCQLMGMTGSQSSGFHPESKGWAERLNQDLVATMKFMVANNPFSWFIMWAEYTHSTLCSLVTGMSRFKGPVWHIPSPVA